MTFADAPEKEDFLRTTIHVAGTFVSMLCCLFVIVTYKMYAPLQKHPSSIFFCMTIASFAFSALFLVEHFAEDHIDCYVAGPLSEFTLVAQEMYLLMFSLDLVNSLKNPFAGDKARMKFYHLIALLASGGAAVVLWQAEQSGKSFFGFCWIRHDDVTDQYNVWTYSLFVIPMICIYFTSFSTLLWARFRLKANKLPETYEARMRVLTQLKLYILAFTAYWTTVGLVFAADQLLKTTDLTVLISLVISIKGVVHLIIWLRIHNFSAIRKASRNGTLDSLVNQEESINWALRREILFYTTKGITRCVEEADLKDEVLCFEEEANQRIEMMLNEEGDQPVYFVDYCPSIFKRLRRHFGVSAKDYIESMSTTTKERFTEGKSGAFLYFTGDQHYIVKTCTSVELQYLRRICSAYAQYTLSEPDTLINKFFGAHAITMYGKTVYFIVVGSIFETDASIHDRFDLKGSWFGRMETSKEYRERGKGVGKDLNFRQKLHLKQSLASRLASQLRKDTNFLASIQSLDYSMLIGIHNQSFQVRRKPNSWRKGKTRCSQADGYVPLHQQDDGGVSVDVVEGPAVYYFGLIDILKEWNLKSRMEYFLKVYILCQSQKGVSVQNPAYYAWRFQKKVVADIVEGGSGADNRAEDIVTPVGDNRRQSILLGTGLSLGGAFGGGLADQDAAVVGNGSFRSYQPGASEAAALGTQPPVAPAQAIGGSLEMTQMANKSATLGGVGAGAGSGAGATEERRAPAQKMQPGALAPGGSRRPSQEASGVRSSTGMGALFNKSPRADSEGVKTEQAAL